MPKEVIVAQRVLSTNIVVVRFLPGLFDEIKRDHIQWLNAIFFLSGIVHY